MCVCERVEGRVGREEVEERLLRAIRDHEAEMVAERTERLVTHVHASIQSMRDNDLRCTSNVQRHLKKTFFREKHQLPQVGLEPMTLCFSA